MAELEMADYTGAILIEKPPNTWGIQTFKIKGAALKPGYPVTMTGETWPEVVTPATTDDVTLGILLENKAQDLDEVYAAGTKVRAALVGSLAAVWTYAKAGVGSLVFGTPLVSDAGAAGPYCIVGEGALYESVGKVIDYSPTDASDDRPVKVALC